MISSVKLPIPTQRAGKVLRKLVRVLEEVGYIKLYLTFGDGHLRFQEVDAYSSRAGGELRYFVELFLLRKRVLIQNIARLLTALDLETLERLEIIDVDEKTVSCRYSFIVAKNLCFFAQCQANPEVYYGDDSIALATWQSLQSKANVLDVCAGPGIQAMVAARRCGRSTAVEINPVAAQILLCNLWLNGLEKRVSVLCGSFQEHFATSTTKYDLITCNPPLLPIPAGTTYPFVGDGGTDGLSTVRALVASAAPHISDGGKIQVIGCAFHTPPRVSVFEDLRNIGTESNLNVSVLASGGFDFAPGSRFFDIMVETACQMPDAKLSEVEDAFRQLAEEGRCRLVTYLAEYYRDPYLVKLDLDYSSIDSRGWFL